MRQQGYNKTIVSGGKDYDKKEATKNRANYMFEADSEDEAVEDVSIKIVRRDERP